MKTTIRLLLVMFVLITISIPPAFAQQVHKTFLENQVPIVSNVRTSNDAQSHILTVTYDLSDAEQDTMRISLTVSNDSGRTYLVPVDTLRGDTGYPVTSGLQKQIRWYYRPEVVNLTPSSSWQIRVAAEDLKPVDIQKIVDQVDSVRLRNDVASIQGIRHPITGLARLNATKDSIEKRFVLHKLQTTRQPFLFEGYEATNIMGRKPGLTTERTTYIISSHFDGVAETPGADDNASAVAGMFEAARLLSTYSFNSTIKFMSFDLEERSGTSNTALNGSRQYVATGIPSYEQIAGVINFDMIGYIVTGTSLGSTIVNIANTASSTLFDTFNTCAGLYVPALQIYLLKVTGNGESYPDSRRSDVTSFWDAGYKGLWLSDGGNLRNPNYHNAGDTLGTLNFTFMTNVVKATVATVASLAGIQHSGVGLSPLFSFSVTSVDPHQGTLPEKFALGQNYPNPFNPETKIEFSITKPSIIKLQIFDLLGREVAVLVNERKPAGRYEVTWDATRFSSGIYFYTLRAGEFQETKRMSLIK